MENAFLASKFAGDILQKRTSEDISFTKLVKMLGIDRASLWRAESGEIPKLENFHTICKWLGNPMEEYFKKPTPPPGKNGAKLIVKRGVKIPAKK